MLESLYSRRRQGLFLAFKTLAYSCAFSISFPYDTPLVLMKLFSSRVTPRNSKKEKQWEERRAFTVSYLISSYGLSQECAKKIAKRVSFDSPERPDTVLDFLKSHGFTLLQISRVVKSYPYLLTADTEATLLPKLEFLHSIGFPRNSLAKIISSNPKFFAYSLSNRLVPCYKFLKGLVSKDDLIVKMVNRSSEVFHLDVDRVLAPRILLLKETGLPESSIMQLLLAYSRIFSLSDEKFSKHLNKVIAMGFNPSSLHFVTAFKAVCHLKEKTWERKIEVYKRWGLSEEEIWLAFKKQPICMGLSEKKINGIMDFLVNVMGLQPSVFVMDPTSFSYSMEKRIIPRLSVVKALQLQGLIEDFNLTSVLRYTDKMFLRAFVDKYPDQMLGLMEIFRGKSVVKKCET